MVTMKDFLGRVDDLDNNINLLRSEIVWLRDDTKIGMAYGGFDGESEEDIATVKDFLEKTENFQKDVEALLAKYRLVGKGLAGLSGYRQRSA